MSGGASDEAVLELVDDVIEIPVYGAPHSFNVATAAAMALSEYARQHHDERSGPTPRGPAPEQDVNMRTPTVVRVTLALLRRGELALARAVGPRRAELGAFRRALACKVPELRFARALLDRKANLWLLRTDQRSFGGDFVVIDLSPPRVVDRSALVLELKRGERVRRVSASRHQVQSAEAVVAAAARATGALLPDAPFEVVLGDPDEVLALLTTR